VSLDDGQPRLTTIAALSPRGQYVWMRSVNAIDEDVGWSHISRVQVLETFGPSSGSIADVMARMQQVPVVGLALPPDTGIPTT
jgi:hypothetical protein